MKKNLLIIVAIFGIVLSMVGTVNAEELKPLDEAAFDLIDDTYSFNIKESEIDLSVEMTGGCNGGSCEYASREVKEIYEKYAKILQEQNYDISKLRGHFDYIEASDGLNSLLRNRHNFHKFIFEDQENESIKKEVAISYSNTSQYNSEDKALVDKIINDFNINITDVADEKEFDGSGKLLSIMKNYDFNSLIKDESIDIKAGIFDMGDGGDDPFPYVFRGLQIYFFKNDLFYGDVHVGLTMVPGVKLSNNLSVVVNRIVEPEQKFDSYNEMLQEAKKQGLNDVLGCYELTALGEVYDGMEVTLDIDSKYNDKNVKVLHKKKDNTYEILESVVKDGKITIKVNEFSPFMVLLSDKQDDSQTTPSEETKPSEETNTNDTSNNAQTSSMNIVLYVSVAIISLIGIVYIMRKRKIA